MAIKSLDDLLALRNENKSRIHLRHGEAYHGEQIEILVGMATCGIAAGARETLSAITQFLADNNIENVKAIPTGCVGHCHLEPVVIISIPEEKPYVYGKVTKEKALQVMEQHVVGKQPVKELLTDIDFGTI